MTRVTVPTSRHRLHATARKVQGQARAPRWNRREHDAYLEIMWGAEPSDSEGLASKQAAGAVGTDTRTRVSSKTSKKPSQRQRVIATVGTRNEKQVNSHHQKFEERVLKAVANGRLREHYVEMYTEHRFPSIAGTANRMASDALFRDKMFNAIQEGAECEGLYLAWDDEHSVIYWEVRRHFYSLCVVVFSRIMLAIRARLGLDLLLTTLPVAHPLVLCSEERAPLPSMSGWATGGGGGDTDDSGSNASPWAKQGEGEELSDSQTDRPFVSDMATGDTDESHAILPSLLPVSNDGDEEMTAEEREQSHDAPFEDHDDLEHVLRLLEFYP